MNFQLLFITHKINKEPLTMYKIIVLKKIFKTRYACLAEQERKVQNSVQIIILAITMLLT